MQKERVTQPKINYGSADWLEFRAYLTQLHDDVRGGLESFDCSPERTAWLRGKAALIKDLLALPRIPVE